jgi:hypothetical protein
MIDRYRQAASHVDRILMGEMPVDLPVRAATKYETVLNLESAKALGLTDPTCSRRPTTLSNKSPVLLRRGRQELARSGNADCARESPLIGVERKTYAKRRETGKE